MIIILDGGSTGAFCFLRKAITERLSSTLNRYPCLMCEKSFIPSYFPGFLFRKLFALFDLAALFNAAISLARARIACVTNSADAGVLPFFNSTGSQSNFQKVEGRLRKLLGSRKGAFLFPRLSFRITRSVFFPRSVPHEYVKVSQISNYWCQQLLRRKILSRNKKKGNSVPRDSAYYTIIRAKVREREAFKRIRVFSMPSRW